MEHKITALKIQKKNPNRVNVYLDEEFAFGLAKIVAAWLSVGQELTAEEIEKLQRQDMTEVAFQAALRLLNYRARSESEIRKNLENKGFTSQTVDEIIERLRASGLLNDERFATDWVENQSNFRPRGRRLLKLEMRMKGLSEEHIESALQGARDEEALAYDAAQRPAQRYARLGWQDFRLKLSQFLARRGFTYPVIAPTVSRLWSELQAGGSGYSSGDGNDEEEDGRWTLESE